MTAQPSQPYQEEPVSFGGSVGMQQPQSTHLGGIHSYRAAILQLANGAAAISSDCINSCFSRLCSKAL